MTDKPTRKPPTRAQLAFTVQLAHDRIGEALKNMRADQPANFCGWCAAAAGKKHDTDCIAWPLIDQRRTFHKLFGIEAGDEG